MPFAKSPLFSLKIQAELSVIKKKHLSVAATCLFSPQCMSERKNLRLN